MYLFRVAVCAALTLLFCDTSAWAHAAHVSQQRSRMVTMHVPLQVDVHDLSRSQVQDLRCMAMNIYHEARGESYRNQLAVAWVVRNRQIRSGRSACAEIYAPGQFGWTVRNHGVPREREAWLRAQHIAHDVMFNPHVRDITQGATHFHESRITPPWSRRAAVSVRIGAHIFHRIEVAQAR